MTTTDTPAVDNGVNVEALLGARAHLTDAPELAQFQWRASCEWVQGTHSRSTVSGFSGLGAEHTHRQDYTFDADHPQVFASEDNGATPPEIVLAALASCLTAGVATVATHRGVQLRSVTATIEGDMDLAGDPRHRRRRPQRLRRHQGHLRHRCRRLEGRPRGDRGPVAEAVGGVRHRGQPDDHPGRGRLRSMMRTPVVVIGAGQAGLAMSHHLTGRGIDHVVLDRGEVANSWRTERWDSLRLLTPNWMTRLPGHCYDGPDPDGFMTKDETIVVPRRYGCSFGAPIRTHVTVEQVRARCDRIRRGHRPGHVVVRRRGRRHGRVERTPPAGRGRRRSGSDRPAHRAGVPQPRRSSATARCSWSVLGIGGADRRRAPAQRATA